MEKLAILIRGPIGSGKSIVCRLLRDEYFGSEDVIVDLDADWDSDGRRLGHSSGRERWADLQHRGERVLIVELAQGEPEFSFAPRQVAGATKNPGE